VRGVKAAQSKGHKRQTAAHLLSSSTLNEVSLRYDLDGVRFVRI
jgi:hypothetical protein